MEATQDRKSDFPEKLKRVGISNLRTLVRIGDKGGEYRFVPLIEITIDLEDKKGIHMSRLIESIVGVVEEETSERHTTFESLEKAILDRVRQRHPCRRADITMHTELVVKRQTPVSKKDTHETHDISVGVRYTNGQYTKAQKVWVVGNTVCPHSMENCGKTHIQRAIAELRVITGFDNKITLQDMIDCVEGAFPSPVYTLLKTEDESSVIEGMYKNPMFVEDVTRKILNNAKKFKGCKISARTVAQESIHRHDVLAEGEIKT